MARMLALAFALCWLGIPFADPAAANEGEAPDDENAALCERAIVNAARRGGVPVKVLYAISLTETGRKTGGRVRPYPWAINREGKGHWFKTREEALAFGEASIAEGRKSFDVGCVQINYRWHGHAFPTLDDMFNPEWTATYAAQFLRTLYEERGDWSAAAGAYHSLTPHYANIYRERFDKLVAGLPEDILGDAETLVASATPDDLRSTRQPRREAQRLVTAKRILDEGPRAPAAMGSLASLPMAPSGPGLLTGGAPMLNEATPLLTAAGGSLF